MKDLIPKFDGKVNTFAVFLLRFIDYALLNVKGVDGLHALDNVQDHTTWYPILKHEGTGAAYHVLPPEEEQLDPTYEAQGAPTRLARAKPSPKSGIRPST